MEITFLGTSCMVPTKERNVSAVYLNYKDKGILFDCGEGTQRQMNIAGIKRSSVHKILITHWHGDHVGGLTGLLHTMNNIESNTIIDIYGPVGTKERMHMLARASDINQQQLRITELTPEGVEKFYENDEYELWCCPGDHAMPVLSFAFVEKDRLNINKAKMKKLGINEGPHLRNLKQGKSIIYKGKEITAEEVTTLVEGKKIVYVLDTRPTKWAVELADGADILIADATYGTDKQEKAEQFFHMTSSEAAQIASQAGVGKLYLTHFSQRYATVSDLEDQAKIIFPESTCAYDFLKVKL